MSKPQSPQPESLTFAINVHGDPVSSQSSVSALAFARAAVDKGHRITRVFFYHDAVRLADNNQVTPQDELSQTDAWAEFADRHEVELAVCIAAAIRRGVLNHEETARYERVAANCHPAFTIFGLGQLVDAALSADSTVTFPA